MQEDTKSWGGKSLFLIAGAAMLLVVLIMGCATSSEGEDRPGIQVIGGESASVSVSGTGSVSASGVVPASGAKAGSGSGSASAGQTTQLPAPSGDYTPVSDVASHAAITLDMRDINELLAPARTDEPVDWAAITAVYEQGGNSVKGDGSVRTLESLATSGSVLAQFPGGADLDGNVRLGLTGVWLGENIDDPTRRQLINKGIQAIIYGKVLQELEAARDKIQQGNTDDASGAPHNVDEAWAFYIGVPGDEGNFPYGISKTARSREDNFGLDGMVDGPLQQALAKALEASRSGDLNAFDDAAAEARGYLNTIFYLATLRYGARVMTDEDATDRKIHLAEGWAFYQVIHPAVSSVSPSSAATVIGHLTRDAANAVPAEDVDRVYAALNTKDVISALGIPGAVRVTSLSQLR